MLVRMIAPDRLAQERSGAPLFGGNFYFHPGRAGRALRPVNPAIRAPDQGIGGRVRILQSESRQMNHRIAIGHVVAVGIRIKEQIRRIHSQTPPLPGSAEVAMFRPSTKTLVLSNTPSPSVSS